MDDARRDSSPPSGVRAPPLTVAPSAAGAPGSPADFGQPRPPLLPGQPNGDARGWAHRYPSPSRARLPTGPQPPPPSPHAHHAPPPLRTPPSFFTGSRRHRGGLPQPPTGGHLAEKGTPQTRWGSRPCPSFPLLHASWRGVSHTPLPMHHMSWPRVAFASPSSRYPKGGGRRPLGGAPRTPGAATPDWRVVGPAGARFEPPPPYFRWPRPPVPPRSPPCPPPRLGRRGPRVRFEPAPPLDALYGQCGPPGERRGPALPRAPPPTTAGARGLAAPGGLLCRGGRGDRALHTRPQLGSVPTAPGTDAGCGVPHRHRAQGRGNSPGHRPPPGRRQVPTAGLILAPHFLFIIIPLGRPGPQSPRRVSSWGRILRPSGTEEQAEVSHPADVGSLRPHGAPGHPGHPSRG